MKNRANEIDGILRIVYPDGTLENIRPIRRAIFEPITEERKDLLGVTMWTEDAGYVLTVEVKDVKASLIEQLQEENSSLRRRLQHLLQSDYIASFDKLKPGTKEYARNIEEAGINAIKSATALQKAAVLINQAALIFMEEG